MRALLAYNPTAGQMWNPFRPEDVVRFLAERGWAVELAPTQGPNDGERIGRQAVADAYDLVIGAGGDGTLNELAQGLAGSPVPLAILPTGTTNVLARELGFPLSIQRALDLIPEGHPHAIDLGIANGRYFLFIVGLGFDAMVSASTDRGFKRWAGFWAFLAATFRNAMNHRPFPVRLQLRDASGRERRLRRVVHQVMISNTELYGTGFRLAQGAQFDDGLLDLLIVRGRRMTEFAFRSARVLLWPFSDNRRDLEQVQVTNVYVRSRRPMPVQVDGEHLGTTPVEIGIRPKALQLWVPEGWERPERWPNWFTEQQTETSHEPF